MSSALGNAIFCDDDDFIGVFDCREAVCDCDRCSVFRKFFETFLYSPFAFIIKSAGSFVKNQDRRVLKEDTGNRNPLFLSSGETGSALAYISGISIGTIVSYPSSKLIIKS